MSLLSTNRIAWTYTADDGTVYRVSALKAHTDQGVQGGADGSGVALPKPGSLKMRRVTVGNATHGSRTVPLYAVGAGLATAGASILLNAGVDSFTFTSSGNPIPEGHIRRSVTRQST